MADFQSFAAVDKIGFSPKCRPMANLPKMKETWANLIGALLLKILQHLLFQSLQPQISVHFYWDLLHIKPFTG